jgi:hypothetical protein
VPQLPDLRGRLGCAARGTLRSSWAQARVAAHCQCQRGRGCHRVPGSERPLPGRGRPSPNLKGARHNLQVDATARGLTEGPGPGRQGRAAVARCSVGTRRAAGSGSAAHWQAAVTASAVAPLARDGQLPRLGRSPTEAERPAHRAPCRPLRRVPGRAGTAISESSAT